MLEAQLFGDFSHRLLVIWKDGSMLEDNGNALNSRVEELLQVMLNLDQLLSKPVYGFAMEKGQSLGRHHSVLIHHLYYF